MLNNASKEYTSAPSDMRGQVGNEKEAANYVIKLKFSFAQESLYGFILLTGDTNTPNLLSIDLIISKEADDLDIRSPWQDLHKAIMGMKGKTETTDKYYDKNRALNNYFCRNFPPSKVERMSKIVLTAGDETLRDILIRSSLADDLKDLLGVKENLLVEVNTEVVFFRTDTIAQEELVEERFKPDGVILEIMPIIDPTNGKRASDVNPGDELMVRITDSSAIGRLVARSLTLDSIDGIVGKVIHKNEELMNDSQGSSIMVQVWLLFEQGINGYFMVHPEVMLKKSSILSLVSSKDGSEIDHHESLLKNRERLFENTEASANEDDDDNSGFKTMVAGIIVLGVALAVAMAILH